MELYEFASTQCTWTRPFSDHITPWNLANKLLQICLVLSILDAKCGFWQIPLNDASSNLTTFMSPYGHYTFLRMPYGICTGCKMFQNVMEQLFIGKSWEIVVDDILIWGHTWQEHGDHLRQVLNRTWAINLKLNPNKMQIQSHLCPLCWPPANG